MRAPSVDARHGARLYSRPVYAHSDAEPGPVSGEASRRRTAAWNLVLGYSQIALTITRNILLVPLYLLFIDVAEYGAWLATAGVLAQLFVSDFGLTATVIQRAADAYGRGDRLLLGRAIGSSLAVSALLALVSTLSSLALAPLVPAMTSGADVGTALLECFVIVAVANGVGIVGLASAGVLRAVQRPVFSGVSVLASDALSVVASVAMLYAGYGLYALAAGHAIRNVLLAIVSLGGCLWISRRRLGASPRWSPGDARGIFAASYYQFFTSIALRIQSKADVFFVGLLLGPTAAAVYGLTARAAETVQMLSGQVVASLDASMAHLHGSASAHRFREVLRVALVSTALVGAAGMAGVAAWNESFVALWVGHELFAGTAASVLLAAAGVFTIVGYVPYVTLQARGEFGQVCRAYLSSALLHLPLLWVLTPFGPWGAALAALLASICRTAILAEALRRCMSLAPRTSWRGARLAAAVTLPACALAAIALAFAPLPSQWPQFVAAVTVFSLMLAIVTWMTNRRLFAMLAREMRLSIGALRSFR
jgi:O-antigen/teichoic acid export membrane protein